MKLPDITQHWKTVAAVVGGVITWAYTALADNHIVTLEWVGLAAAIATAIGVYNANGPSATPEEDPEPVPPPGP